MSERLFGQTSGPKDAFTVEAREGFLLTYRLPNGSAPALFESNGPFWSQPRSDLWNESLHRTVRDEGRFIGYNYGVVFPLWYPTLVFGLAGVAAVRFGRRFTLRSAIIATTIVAGLLAMAAAAL